MVIGSQSLILAVLEGMKYYVIVVLICLPIRTHGIEGFFLCVCLKVICISFGKLPFKISCSFKKLDFCVLLLSYRRALYSESSFVNCVVVDLED